MTADPSPGQSATHREELEELYRQEAKMVIGLLLWLGATWELAEDVTQEAFLQAQRCWGKRDRRGAAPHPRDREDAPASRPGPTRQAAR